MFSFVVWVLVVLVVAVSVRCVGREAFRRVSAVATRAARVPPVPAGAVLRAVRARSVGPEAFRRVSVAAIKTVMALPVPAGAVLRAVSVRSVGPEVLRRVSAAATRVATALPVAGRAALVRARRGRASRPVAAVTIGRPEAAARPTAKGGVRTSVTAVAPPTGVASRTSAPVAPKTSRGRGGIPAPRFRTT